MRIQFTSELEAVRINLIQMGETTSSLFSEALSAVTEPSPTPSARASELEAQTDHLHRLIHDQCLNLITLQAPVARCPAGDRHSGCHRRSGTHRRLCLPERRLRTWGTKSARFSPRPLKVGAEEIATGRSRCARVKHPSKPNARACFRRFHSWSPCRRTAWITSI